MTSELVTFERKFETIMILQNCRSAMLTTKILEKFRKFRACAMAERESLHQMSAVAKKLPHDFVSSSPNGQ